MVEPKLRELKLSITNIFVRIPVSVTHPHRQIIYLIVKALF